ncbi:MAG: hypothetical protein HY554_09070 [Elusimicrobia bacterium]|nr:hypothetical protein [Elusimicrobiota bacterium]
MSVRAESAIRQPARAFAALVSAAFLLTSSGGLFPAWALIAVQPAGASVSAAGGSASVAALGAARAAGLSPVANGAVAPVTLSLPRLGSPALGPVQGLGSPAQAAAPALGLTQGFQLLAADAALPAPVLRSRPSGAKAEEAGPSARDSAQAAADPKIGGKAYDGGIGFLPTDKAHHPELNLGERPAAPEASLSWDARHFQAGTSILDWLSGPNDAIVLEGNPTDEAGVEAALRKLIGSRPDLFSKLTANDFRTVYVKHVKGQEGLEDMYYAKFVQQKDTLVVDGSRLSFEIKASAGKTVVIASRADLFPEAGSVETSGRLSDPQLEGKAYERLGIPPSSGERLRDLDRQIMFWDGKWRTAQVYQSQSLVVRVAVDVATGETHAWDPRVHFQLQASEGSVAGRGVADGPHTEKVELAVLPMNHIEVQGPEGKKFFADKDGAFVVPGAGDKTVELRVSLRGRYATVEDQEKQTLSAVVKAKPGERVRIVFNQDGADENSVAQVNAYYHITYQHDWLVARGINLERLNRPMPIYTNQDDDCNAYYTPGSPGIYPFKSSSRCRNTSYNDVLQHEYGHAVDDAAGGIANGALSEGWGDILAMFITGQPIVGRGFLKQPRSDGSDYVREGNNTYQYKRGDEVHEQGKAWMGFAWKLRKNLIASIGDPARAAALAEHLVVPVLLASARDIPSAIQQVLLRDLDANGNAPHLKEIQAAAASHGIAVTLPKKGDSEGLLSVMAAAAGNAAARLSRQSTVAAAPRRQAGDGRSGAPREL